MKRFATVTLALMSLTVIPAASQADLTETISGSCEGGQYVASDFTINFTPTGGDFNAGTGTATATITLENTSGLYPFQVPALGNPIQTSFFFNVPPTASVAMTDASILAGSSIVSTGTIIDGVPIPPGCVTLIADQSQPTWYVLQSGVSAGEYGIFTSGLETSEGIKAGLVDPEVYVACVAQGDVFSPLVVAGRVRFTLSLGNLGTTLDSAEDFASLCSNPAGSNDPFAFAAKFQGTAVDGEGSCFIGHGCETIPVDATTWGAIKAIYR